MVSERPAVVIGDVHGNVNILTSVLYEIDRTFGKADVYSTGDLIDRGIHTKDVIDFCIEKKIKPVLGNHEIWLHRYLTTGRLDSFVFHRAMQGHRTLLSYGLRAKSPEDAAEKFKHMIPEAHKKFILGLPIWRQIETGGHTFRLSHAGLKRKAALKLLPVARRIAHHHGGTVSDALCQVVEDGKPSLVIWTKNSFKQPDLWGFTDGSIQVFGHSPTPGGKPLVEKKWIAIPTGRGDLNANRVVAYNLTTGDHIQVTEIGSRIRPGEGICDLTL